MTKTISTKTTVDCPQSTIVSGTTPSGCTLRAPTGSDPTRPDRVEETNYQFGFHSTKYKDYSRLPAVHRSLGDYTQWVHLACPHSSKRLIDTPSGRTDIKIFGKEILQIAYPNRTSGESTDLDVALKS